MDRKFKLIFDELDRALEEAGFKTDRHNSYNKIIKNMNDDSLSGAIEAALEPGNISIKGHKGNIELVKKRMRNKAQILNGLKEKMREGLEEGALITKSKGLSKVFEPGGIRKEHRKRVKNDYKQKKAIQNLEKEFKGYFKEFKDHGDLAIARNVAAYIEGKREGKSKSELRNILRFVKKGKKEDFEKKVKTLDEERLQDLAMAKCKACGKKIMRSEYGDMGESCARGRSVSSGMSMVGGNDE